MYAMRQSLRPGDRSRYRLLGNNLPQRAFGTYLAGGFVEGRSLWLRLRKAAARSSRKPGSHHKNRIFFKVACLVCGIPTHCQIMTCLLRTYISYGSILLKNELNMSCRATKPEAKLFSREKAGATNAH